MSEVWRARDTKLLASLDPHFATIHGLEEDANGLSICFRMKTRRSRHMSRPTKELACLRELKYKSRTTVSDMRILALFQDPSMAPYGE